MEARKPVRTIRTAVERYDLFEPRGGIEEIYVDGFDTVTYGASVAKITLYSVHDLRQEDSGPVEQRTLRLRLTMPTTTLYELVLGVSKMLAEGGDGMRQALGSQRTKAEQLVDALEALKRNVTTSS